MVTMEKGILAAIGGTVFVLVATNLLGPIATAATSANTSLAAYTSAQSLSNQIPLFAVVGVIVGVISLMVVALIYRT